MNHQRTILEIFPHCHHPIYGDHYLPTNHSIPGRIIGSTHYLYSCTQADESSGTRKRKLKRSISALLITAETIFVFSYPSRTNCLDDSKQTTRYQSGPTDIY